MANYRNKNLLNLAKDIPCQACAFFDGCKGEQDTTVWCHSNFSMHGKGRGIKAHDCFGGVACFSFHHWLDEVPAPREEKIDALRKLMENTLLYMWQSGMIEVSGKGQPKEKKYVPPSKIVPRNM